MALPTRQALFDTAEIYEYGMIPDNKGAYATAQSKRKPREGRAAFVSAPGEVAWQV
jgi:hypothetical protein